MLIANTATTSNLNQAASKERPLLRNSFPVQDYMQGQTGLLERETGFEPATPCLEGRHSTAELLPLAYRLSINFVLKSRVGNIIGNGSQINLPQCLPHLEPN